jgi:hypothetical protein
MPTNTYARHLGRTPAGREVFVLQLSDLRDFPREVGLPCSRFILLLAADFSSPTADRYRIAERIMDAGCVYLCTWGPYCELMHDLADEAFVMKQLSVPNADGTIMTTWHVDDSLAEVVEFALRSTEPDAAFSAGCEAILLVAVPPTASGAELEAAARSNLTF